jgi:hypothetical protein
MMRLAGGESWYETCTVRPWGPVNRSRDGISRGPDNDARSERWRASSLYRRVQ